jgi:hypothetical protein
MSGAVNRVARTVTDPRPRGEQAADQRNGVVLLGGGDLHLGRRTDDAGGHQGRAGGMRGHHWVLLGHLDQS